MADFFDQFRTPAPAPDFFDQFRAKPDPFSEAKTKLDELDKRLYESAAPEAKPVVDTGGIGAIGHGLQQGLTFGWQPKIDAAAYAALTGVGSNKSFGERYQEQLAKNRAEGETLHEAHPVTDVAADFVGGTPAFSTGLNPVAAAGLAGAARAAGESENVLGEQGTNLRGLAETATGGATGALTSYLLPKLFGRLAGRAGKKADEAAKQTVTFGTQTARDKFERAMAPLGEMAPGETATILNRAGAAGGFRGQRGTLEGIQSAKQALGEEFGGIIQRAADTHPGVPMTSVEPFLAKASEENLANNYMGKVSEDIRERLSRFADKNGIIQHDKMQEVLETLNKTASKIYSRPRAQWTENNEAFIAGYKALRGAQAEGLEAATGVNANDLRKYMATFYGLEQVAQKAVNRFEGNDKIGLLGELKKSQGKTSIGHGILATATGSPGIGVPMILKGVLDVTRGQLGKSTGPLRSNLSTSLNLTKQQAYNAIARSDAARLGLAKLASEYGADLGGSAYDRQQDQEEPIIPMAPAQMPPPVAEVLPKSRKGRK